MSQEKVQRSKSARPSVERAPRAANWAGGSSPAAIVQVYPYWTASFPTSTTSRKYAAVAVKLLSES